jgi:hypothetical protein
MTNLVSLFVVFWLLTSPNLPLSVDIQDNQAVADYPDRISFSLKASSDDVIESVELIFGSDVITCGESLTRAFPEDYEPGKEVDIEWEWILRRSGGLPPGTEVWWQWILTDDANNEFVTPRQSIIFTDESIPWQIYQSESLNIYWTEGDQAFAQELAEAGETALDSLFVITGVRVKETISVYVYPSAGEMQNATLFAPSWSGGLAFIEHRTVLAGIPTDNLSWGRAVVAHEVTHVLIGVYTFSCASNVPLWLHEGLAMYAEQSVGADQYDEDNRLRQAVDEDTLLTVREISRLFSNDPDIARLSYAQSLSLVEFLFKEYGQEKMLAFLDTFRDGYSQDQALDLVYGLNQDSLHDVWRSAIGAAPLKDAPVHEATATRTLPPTLAPITGPHGQATSTLTPTPDNADATPTPIPATPTPATTLTKPVAEEVPEPVEPDTLAFPVFLIGGIVLVLVLIIGIVFIMKKSSTAEKEN